MRNLRFSRLFAYVLLVAVPFWFNACKKDDNTTTPTPSNSVEGTYKVSALQASPAVLGQFSDLLSAAPLVLGTSCLTDVSITFKTGGTVSTDNPTSCQQSKIPASSITGVDAASKWSQSGSTLSVTTSTGTKTDYTVLSTGAVMKLQWKGDADFANTGKPTSYTYTMDLKRQ
ncbi:hypothetical protein GCM10027592_09790 [Spirosoma flavus]